MVRATSVVYKSGTGPDDEIWKGVSKLMEIKVDLPNNFFGDVKLEVNNKDYTDPTKIIDFCGIFLVGAGDNLPCVRLVNDTEPVLRTPEIDVFTDVG